MAYCTHCGASLPDGAKFCPVCGKAVATVSARTSADSTILPRLRQGRGDRLSKNLG